MTDQALDYEELLKRGRELYELVRPQYIQQIRKRLDAPYLLLALFERHLAQRVREGDDEEPLRMPGPHETRNVTMRFRSYGRHKPNFNLESEIDHKDNE